MFLFFLGKDVIADKKYKNVPVTLTVARICINHKTQCTLSILMSIAANDIWKLQKFLFYININIFLSAPFTMFGCPNHLQLKWTKTPAAYFLNLWCFETTLSWHFILLLLVYTFFPICIHNISWKKSWISTLCMFSVEYDISIFYWS